LQQSGLDTEFGGNHARDARGPIQRRVAHGAGDFFDCRVGCGDIEQPALASIKCQASRFDLQRELRDLEAG
jgi:hypothetical protein